MFDPSKDGINHINVYSQGKTFLGTFLSNWYKYPVRLDNIGTFDSIEGLWYWLSTRDNRLKTMSGFAAKQLGRSLPKVVTLPDDEFKCTIKQAIKIKVAGGPQYTNFVDSTLPFAHYYMFNGKQVDAGHKWIIEYLEQLRTELKEALINDKKITN
jgi:hypothetical protein